MARSLCDRSSGQGGVVCAGPFCGIEESLSREGRAAESALHAYIHTTHIVVFKSLPTNPENSWLTLLNISQLAAVD